MGLNIKNERVHALAREAARRSGLSQTGAIERALERLLDDLPADGAVSRREAAMTWFDSVRGSVTDEDREAVRAAELDMYDDETGLPR